MLSVRPPCASGCFLRGYGPLRKPGALPSDASIASWLSRKIASRLRGERKSANQTLTWRLAIRKCAVPLHVNTSRDALAEFRWLPTARGHNWADPRLFSHGSSNWLFFEQWQNGLTKGEIWRGLLGQDGSLSEVKPCLRQPYNLSYPQLLEERRDLSDSGVRGGRRGRSVSRATIFRRLGSRKAINRVSVR